MSRCEKCEINYALLRALKDLVEQFNAYENGWLGHSAWRYRIGLVEELRAAETAIKKAGEL